MVWLLTSVLALVLPALAWAQIATDGSLGPPATVFSGPDFTVPSGAGKLAGQSLFFSFSNFGVPDGESVTFTKDPGTGAIDTVVSRVTGGAASEIFGDFRSQLGEKNFYFLNPWGVVFGPDSCIHVGGSFHVSTADEIRDSTTGFSARAPSDTILTGRPETFGFLSVPDRGDLEIRGKMVVGRGETIDLVGGDVRVDGAFVWAPGGLVRIASVGSSGDVVDHGDGSRLDVTTTGALGSIEIIDESTVTVSGFETPLATFTIQGLLNEGLLFVIPAGAIREGDVQIGQNASGTFLAVLRGPATGRVFVQGDSLLVRDSDIRGLNYGAEPGGIEIDVDGLLELRKQESEFDVGILARSESMPISNSFGFLSVPVLGVSMLIPAGTHTVEATGQGPQLRVQAGEIALFDGARISATTFAAGRGGDILAQADRSILISGVDSDAEHTPTAIFSNSQGVGDAGSIRVETSLLQLVDGGGIIAQTTGDGDAGSIDIDVDRLEILGTSQIDSSTSAQSLPPLPPDDPTTTSGEGGNIDILARDSILLSGGIDDQLLFARVSTFSQQRSTGSAGSIHIETPWLEIEDGAGISVTTRGAGTGGDIDLEVGSLALRDGGKVSARSDAEALAGNITVDADQMVTLDSGAAITASTQSGEGGNVSIDAGDALVMRGGSAIIAEAAELGGSGGLIQITTPVFVKSADSSLSAAAPGGPEVQGEVSINSPEVDIESRVTPVQAAFLDPAALVRQSCAARAAGDIGGSFTVARQRAFRAAPEEFLLAFGGVSSQLAPIEPTPGAAGNQVQIAQASAAEGTSAFRGGDYDQALALLAKASESYAEAGDARGQADALRGMAESQQALGMYAESLRGLNASLEEARASGEAAREAAVLGSLGDAYLATGDTGLAEEHLSRAVELSRQLGAPGLRARLLNNQGNLRMAQRRFGDALVAYEESAQLAGQANDPPGTARALASAARAALESGEATRGAARLAEAKSKVDSLPCEP